MSALPPQELHGTRCLTHPVVPHASPLSRHLNISTQDPVAHPPERTGHRTERRPSGHRHTQRSRWRTKGRPSEFWSRNRTYGATLCTWSLRPPPVVENVEVTESGRPVGPRVGGTRGSTDARLMPNALAQPGTAHHPLADIRQHDDVDYR